MPVVQQNGLSFHTQALGAGPPAVMLHGLLIGSMTTWYFGAAPRLARSHRVLLYDLRGHGKSARAHRGYDLATMVRDLDALLANFTGEPATLVGHSYGALTALRFAMLHPERVARLVLVEAPLPPLRLPELDHLLRRPRGEMASALPEELRRALQRGGRQALRLVDQLAFLAAESSLLADLDAEPEIGDAELAALACPLLAIYGHGSSCRPAGDRLRRLVPGAQLVLLPGGHFLPTEAAEALTHEIVRFCAGKRDG